MDDESENSSSENSSSEEEKKPQDNTNRNVIIVIVIVVLLILLLFLLVSSVNSQNSSSSSVDAVPETDGYYTTIPAGSIITVHSDNEIPFGGTLSDGENFSSAMKTNETLTFSSVQPTTLNMSKRVNPTVSNGAATFSFPVPNDNSINYISLVTQGFLNCSNGLSFQGNTPVSLGNFVYDGFYQISSVNSTMTLSYNL